MRTRACVPAKLPHQACRMNGSRRSSSAKLPGEHGKLRSSTRPVPARERSRPVPCLRSGSWDCSRGDVDGLRCPVALFPLLPPAVSSQTGRLVYVQHLDHEQYDEAETRME
jgi:hypothetical protein